jgi:2-polyprenyl-3-methyl-5-hydroxy-6-metoxy-1,4-benzoquinol methylase
VTDGAGTGMFSPTLLDSTEGPGWHDVPVTTSRGELIRSRLRAAVARRLRNVAPGRRLRLRLALAEIEAGTTGRESVRVLDAGSEEGLLCLELARRHPDWALVAADIAEEPLRRGREWARAEGLAVHWVRCDLQRPLGRSIYDAVVALESLEEIPDDAAAMRSLAAALRSGGLFVVHVPTADWTPVLRSAERTWRREARHGYDADALVATLDRLGLEVRRVDPTFRRTGALAQDFRDKLKHRGRWTQLALLPLMAAAVTLERAGITWGPPRGLLVVAVRR